MARPPRRASDVGHRPQDFICCDRSFFAIAALAMLSAFFVGVFFLWGFVFTGIAPNWNGPLIGKPMALCMVSFITGLSGLLLTEFLYEAKSRRRK